MKLIRSMRLAYTFLALLIGAPAFAAITYVGTGAVTQSAAATISPAIPAGSNGDLILCTAAYHNPNFTLPTPSGAAYTELDNQFTYHKIWARIATGTDTFTLGTTAAPLAGYVESYCGRYRGTSSNLSTITDVVGFKHFAQVDALRLAALTPTFANEMLFYSGRFYGDSTGIASPTGFTERVDSPYSASSTTLVAGDWIQGNPKTVVAQQDLAVTGGPGTSVTSTTLIIAIKPAGQAGGGGSAWAFRAAGGSATGTATTITPSLPPGQVAGDWLCWAGLERDITKTLQHPSGYLPMVTKQNAGHDISAIDCKISTGASETAPSTTLGGQGLAMMVAFTGGPPGVTGQVDGSNTILATCTQNPPTPAVTITHDNSLVIDFSYMLDDFGTITAAPTGFTTIGSAVLLHSGPSNTGAMWAYQIQTTASSTSADTFTTTPAGTSGNCRGLSVALLAGTSTAPTITNVNTTNIYSAAATGLVITGTGFGATQGTGNVTLRDGSTVVTQTVTSWSDTSITFNSVLGDSRLGSRFLRVTKSDSTTADTAVTVTAAPGTCSFDLGTLVQPFAVDKNGAPNRFGDKAPNDIDDNSQILLSSMIFSGVSTCANITVQPSGVFKVPVDFQSAAWQWNSGSGWKDTSTQRIQGSTAGKVRIKASGGFRASCTGVLGDNTAPPVRGLPQKTICTSGCDYPATSTGITNCMAALANGQTCEMRAAQPVTAEVWAADITITGVNGAENAVKTLRVRDGDSIILEEATTDPAGLLNITNSSHINIQGNSTGQDGLQLGDGSAWKTTCSHSPTASDYTAPFNCYLHARTVMITGSSDIGLFNLEAHGAAQDVASVIDNTSSYIYLRQADVNLHGNNNNHAATSPAEQGDLFQVNAPHFLTEDTSFSHGGADALKVTGSFAIMRRILADGLWSDVTADTVYKGNHAFVLAEQECNLASYGCSPYGPALIENSEFRNSGKVPSRSSNIAVPMGGIGVIFRTNYVYGNDSNYLIALCSTADSGTTAYRDGEWGLYNNTLFGGATVWTAGAVYPSGIDGQICKNMTIANNLFEGAQPGLRTGDPYAFTWKVGSLPLGGFANHWKGGRIFSNIFAADPANPSLNMQFALTGTGAATKAVTDTTTWPSNVFGNKNVTIKWANGTTSPSPSRDGLVLDPTNTVAIGDAASITTTTNSGTGVTSLTLANPRLFKDDWGFTGHSFGGFHTEYGDCIAVGPTAGSASTAAVSARITGINYSTGVVTVATPLTFAVGSQVWKAVDYLDGTCGRPMRNKGAAQ